MDFLVILVIILGIVSSITSKSKEQQKANKTRHVHNVSASDELLHHDTVASGGESGRPSLRQRMFQETRRKQEQQKAQNYAERERMREQQDQKNRAEDQARQRQEQNRRAAEKRKKEQEKLRKEIERKQRENARGDRSAAASAQAFVASQPKDTAEKTEDVSAAAMFNLAMEQNSDIGEIDISGCMDEVFEKIVCGYTPELPSQRDFLAEAEDMISSYTL